MRWSNTVSAFALPLLLAACAEEAPCLPRIDVEHVGLAMTRDVDVLFVIDNAGSIAEEQESLALRLPLLVEAVTSGDLDPTDGPTRGRDFPPAESLHVGVISTDMGTGGFSLPGCTNTDLGDDGVLSQSADPSRMGCPESYPSRFLTYDPAAPDRLASDASCLVAMGIGGCGWEQPLEAALKAITPSGQAPEGAFDGRFQMGTVGHADGANAGFLRPNSVLAIVVLTNELDCSVSDPRVFDPSSDDFTSDDVFSRCFLDPEVLHPIGRYVDGFLAQRPASELLVFGVIAGIPLETATVPGEAPAFPSILDHPDMEARVDPGNPSRLRPSCRIAGTGEAFPPRRLVELAGQLHERGAAGVVQSICQADLQGPVESIVHAIADALRPSCVEEREVDEGLVDCHLFETLPAEMTCASLPGRMPAGLDMSTGRELCRVTQARVVADEPAGAGWYYDDFAPETERLCGRGGQRIVFTPGSEPPNGTQIRLECPSSHIACASASSASSLLKLL